MSKILWTGGIHGVGKTTILKRVLQLDSSLNYVYLGRMFYEEARRKGFLWEDLTDESNLLEIEEKITGPLNELAQNSDLLIDSHFKIYLNNISYLGFHEANLRRLFGKKDIKGLIHLIADPHTILTRRKKNPKELTSYLTVNDEEIIKKEIEDSKDGFDYFERHLKPSVKITIDTSISDVEQAARQIVEEHHEM